jgi:hypothetical protein
MMLSIYINVLSFGLPSGLARPPRLRAPLAAHREELFKFLEEVVDVPAAALSLAPLAASLAAGKLRPKVAPERVKAKAPGEWPLPGPRGLLLIGIHACGLIYLSLLIIGECLVSPIRCGG